ncbi:hypothetical protein FRC02_011087 [Tulasnella sp. 418]|nr:hypothetical protein FRC02_011087 [Tulasnella sp. 418]
MLHRTVAVLGASYGGVRAAQILAAGLSKKWKVILIDRNDHANHLYVFPRMVVLPGHDEKAFIPYTGCFSPFHVPGSGTPLPPPITADTEFIHANIVSLSQDSVVYEPITRDPETPKSLVSLGFDYVVYALGAQVPSPANVWSHEGESHGRDRGTGVISIRGTKAEGIEWFQKSQDRIKEAKSVLVVGAGAMGIQFASDIKDVYPDKRVTLIHSRNYVMPIYKKELRDIILNSLKKLGVEVILGERIDLKTAYNIQYNDKGERIVRTLNGRELDAELVLLCTGQKPNTDLLGSFAAEAIHPIHKTASVLRTLQIAKVPQGTPSWIAEVETLMQKLDIGEEPAESSVVEQEPKDNSEQAALFPNVFVIGDACDGFGAIKAGHVAHHQAEVAANNIIHLIKREGAENTIEDRAHGSCDTSKANNVLKGPAGTQDTKLEEYKPGLPAIKISLGRRSYCYQLQNMVGERDDGHDDLEAPRIWPYFGADPSDLSA